MGHIIGKFCWLKRQCRDANMCKDKGWTPLSPNPCWKAAICCSSRCIFMDTHRPAVLVLWVQDHNMVVALRLWSSDNSRGQAMPNHKFKYRKRRNLCRRLKWNTSRCKIERGLCASIIWDLLGIKVSLIFTLFLFALSCRGVIPHLCFFFGKFHKCGCTYRTNVTAGTHAGHFEPPLRLPERWPNVGLFFRKGTNLSPEKIEGASEALYALTACKRTR